MGSGTSVRTSPRSTSTRSHEGPRGRCARVRCRGSPASMTAGAGSRRASFPASGDSMPTCSWWTPACAASSTTRATTRRTPAYCRLHRRRTSSPQFPTPRWRLLSSAANCSKAPRANVAAEVSRGSETDLVTGAFSYSGSRIAELLLQSGRAVRTLTHHPQREHPLQARVEALPYRFDDHTALARSLEGVSSLYNTYWVRWERGGTTFAKAVANSKALFEAARRAGVRRIVHVSITNPSIDSPMRYYRAKALAEQALAACNVPYTIVRPTWFFGGHDVITNNIAWVIRHLPIVVIPGDGQYLVQPIHVDDFAQICLRAADGLTDAVTDAVGPDRMTYEQLVRAVRDALHKKTPVVHAPSAAVDILSRALGVVVRDVVLTGDEIRALTAGLLVSNRPALGQVSFLEWLQENASTLGRVYANDLDRHFRVRR